MLNFRWIWQVLFNLSVLCQCLSVYELSTSTSLFSPQVNHICCWLETQVQGSLSSSSMQLRLCHALCLQQELDPQVQVCASSAVTGHLFTHVCLYRSLLCMWTYMLRLLWAQLKQRTAVEEYEAWSDSLQSCPFVCIHEGLWWVSSREPYKPHPEAPLNALLVESDLDLYFWHFPAMTNVTSFQRSRCVMS